MLPATTTPTTKHRILDAAERLFAFNGFDATSLRMITTEAGVNLAAVNYHFQSKDALLHAVFARRAGPVNQRRLQLLDKLETGAGNNPVPVEAVLEAFLRPVLEAGNLADCIPKMMVRMQYVESDETFRKVFEAHFKPVVLRFRLAMRRSLPGLPEEELFWRMQFAIGGFTHIFAGSHLIQVFSEGRFPTPAPEATLRRLIQYAAAGLRAPVREVRL
ncbi:MAG: TetR/AcrR family transcriptional regulator [Acidobacteria bacterium]|nr:TetR/AcrR family transcriptional regulator [Acidobacteriota bacterium]